MCGFFGIYRASGKINSLESKIVAAGQTLSHRGPDDEGIYCDEYFGVHFRRLAIIDLSSSGHQPMVSADGRLVVAFNGEIYNYRELRKTLTSCGHTFTGNSDSEVLLASFVEWGDQCVKHLRGMFAILIWDTETQILHVFRDRLGIKPLYLYQDGDAFLFASEIKAILAYAPEAAKANERAVFKFLARGWVDDTEETFYSDITCIPPAISLRIEKGSVTRERFWHPTSGNNHPYNMDEFRDTFSETVSLHLQADVPLAATLSGGMDSSSIVALAAKAASKPEEIQAFSVIPPETIDESFWIDCTVKKTGINHSYLQPNWDEMPEIFDEVITVHDEPFQSSSCIYQYLLRREVASRGIKVLLVGEGGDEVLGGYRRLFLPYLYALKEDGRDTEFNNALDSVQDFLGFDRSTVLSQLETYRNMIIEGGSGQENMSAYGLLNDEFIARHNDLVSAPAYPPLESDNPNRFFAHLIEHLSQRDIPYVLRMEDRNSMAHGIEARVPFLDHYFLDKTFSYDYAEFMRNGENKSMLRRAMMGILPEEVVDRRDKSPRPGSNVHFIYNVLVEKMREILSSSVFRESPWWRDDCAEQFEHDRAALDPQRAEVWFRFYSVTRWTSLLLKG